MAPPSSNNNQTQPQLPPPQQPKGVEVEAEAKYLRHLRGPIVDNCTSRQETFGIWMTIFHKYFRMQTRYMHEPLTGPTPGQERTFVDWKITYYLPSVKNDGKHPGQVVLLGQFNDTTVKTDWDVEKGGIYKTLASTDHGTPSKTTKSLGLLASGTQFVLYEVVGSGKANYLIGSPKSPAKVTDKATSLQVQTKFEEYLTASASSKCKLDVITQGVKAGAASSAK